MTFTFWRVGFCVNFYVFKGLFLFPMERSVAFKKVEGAIDGDSAGDCDDGDEERQAPVVSFLPYQESLYFSVSHPPSFSSSALSGEPWLHNF